MELKSLGQLSLQQDADELLRSNPRGKLLVLILRHAKGAEITRGHLISLLWGEPPSKRTRHSLCQLIYTVRRAAPGLGLTTRADSVRLNASSFPYDVEQLIHAAKNGQWETVAALHTGQFLDPAQLPAGVAIDHWRDDIVAELNRQLKRAYCALMAQAEAVASWEAAYTWSDRLLSLDRYDESAHAIHLRAIAATVGLDALRTRIGEIRAEFESANLCMQEPDLLAAIEQAEQDAQVDMRAAAVDTLRFRGRHLEVADLTRAWSRAATGQASAVHVTGQAGVGKTRLIDHFLRWSAIKGSCVLFAKSSPADSRLPYTSLIELLRSAVKPAHVRMLPEPWQSAIAGLLPEYAVEAGGEAVHEQRRPDAARRHMFDATVKLFEQITAGRGPLVVFLDDAHWSDRLSAWAIHFIFHRLADSRVLLILASREKVDVLPEQLRLLVQTLPEDRAVEVRLGPLTEEAALELAREAAINLGGNTRQAFLASVVAAADRIPYFIIQGIRDSMDRDLGRCETDFRMDNLSQPILGFLQALAVLSPRPTADTLRRMLDVSVTEFRSLVVDLRRRGLVKEAGGCIQFSHDIVRDLTLATLDSSALAGLNARAAALLVDGTSTPPGLLALHYVGAGDDAKAHEWALRAGRIAFEAAALNDAEFYLLLAMNRASTVDEQLAGSGAIIDFLCNIEKVEEARQWLRRYPEALAHLPDDTARLISLYAMIVEGDTSINAFERQIGYLLREAQTYNRASQYTLVRKVLGLAHSTGFGSLAEGLIRFVLSHRAEFVASPEAAKLLAALSRVWCIYEDGPTALTIADEAIRMASVVRDKSAQMLALVARGTVRMLLGRLRDAELDYALAERVSLPARLGAYIDRMHINRAVLLIETQRFSEAIAALERVIPTCSVDDQLLARANLAIASLESRDLHGLTRRILDLRRTNAMLQLKWVELFADCMDGYLFYESRDWGAMESIAKRIEHEQLKRSDAAASDSSYADVLIGRAKMRTDTATALDYLSRAAKRHARGNSLGMLRIRIEEARIVKASSPATANRMLRRILTNCELAGATTLARRAREIA